MEGPPGLIKDAYIALARGTDLRDLTEKLLDIVSKQQTLISNLRDTFTEYRLTTSIDIATLKTIAKSQSASIEKLETGKRPLPIPDLKLLDKELEAKRLRVKAPVTVCRVAETGPDTRSIYFTDGTYRNQHRTSVGGNKAWTDVVVQNSPPGSPEPVENCSFTL